MKLPSFSKRNSFWFALGLLLGSTPLFTASIMNGDFGVGIATPGAKVDVQGNGNTSASSALRVRNSTPADILTARDDQRVGIATAAPDYTLDVNGDIGLNQYLYHNADADTFLNFGLDNLIIQVGGVRMVDFNETTADSVVFNENGADVDFRVEGSGATNALFVQGSDGNVGIGTSLPTYALDVAGNAGIDQYLFHNDDANTYIDFNADSISLVSGGIQMIDLTEAANDVITMQGALNVTGTSGTTPVSGAGTRLMWVPAKSAIRAGRVTGTDWDDGNIGNDSTAFGSNAQASGTASFAAGNNVTASGNNSVAVGSTATASGDGSFAFGNLAAANGDNSIAMGNLTVTNSAAQYSMAFGLGAQANSQGSVVIKDSAGIQSSFGVDTMTMKFAGGYRLYTGGSGAALPSGATSWTTTSDRNAKAGFRPVDTEAMLQKVPSFEISTWHYKTQPATRRHYGPMAQDFYRAYGNDDHGKIGYKKMIASHEFSSVNFYLIHALEKRSSDQKLKIEELNQQNQQLKERLDRLSSRLEQLESRLLAVR